MELNPLWANIGDISLHYVNITVSQPCGTGDNKLSSPLETLYIIVNNTMHSLYFDWVVIFNPEYNNLVKI